MANFNPKINDTGIGPNAQNTPVVDASLGNLFANVGDLASKTATVIDNQTQDNIKKQVQTETDSIQNEFGVGAARTLQASVTDPVQPTPAALNSASRKLKDVQTAYSQGRLTDSSYYARLDSMVRQIKAQHPAYEDQIDTIVQSVTGVTPANALQRSLMSDYAASTKADASIADKNMSYVRSNSQYLAPGVFDDMASGKVTVEEAMSRIQRAKSREQSVKAQTSDMAAASASRTLTQGDAFKSAKTVTSSIISEAIDKGVGAVGLSYKKLTSAIDSAKSDGITSPQEQQQIRAAWADLKLQANQTLTDTLSGSWNDNGESYTSILDKDQLQDLRDTAMMPLNTIEDALVNKDLGVLKATSLHAQDIKDNATLQVLTGPDSDVIQSTAALSKLVGPEVLNSVLMQNNMEGLNRLQTATSLAMSSNVISGRASLDDQIKTLSKTGNVDPKVVNSVIKNVTDTITDKSVPPETVTNAAKALFDISNNDLVQNFKKSERMDIFTRLASPAVSARIKELGKNDPELVQKYAQWTTSQFSQLFREEADAVTGSLPSDATHIKVTYNPTTAQFDVVDTSPSVFSSDPKERIRAVFGDSVGQFITPMFLRADSVSRRMETIRSVNKINKGLTSLKGVMEITGEDPTKALYTLAGTMTGGAKELGFYGTLMDSVKASQDPKDMPVDTNTEASPDTKTKVAPVPLSKPDTSMILNNEPDMASLTSSVIKHESGGQTGLTSSAGAHGLMQLMPETAKAMANELGIPYDENKLKNDAQYNQQLGERYLAKLQDRFGSSALAVAAYNAGPSKVDQWIRKFGDPRTDAIDITDWVQKIPYQETRKYVQKVMLSAYN